MLRLKDQLNHLAGSKLKNKDKIRVDLLDTMEGQHKFEIKMEELGLAHLQIAKHLADLESDEILRRLLMAQIKCVVRIYVIDAFNLSSRDSGGASDPYLILSLGGRSYNER